MAEFTVSAELWKIVDEANETVKKTADKCIKEVAKETVDKLKTTSPKKHGKYAQGWTTRRFGQMSMIVYNKVYQLTHLLEWGHVVWPAPTHSGKQSRVNGIPHILPAEEWANKEVVDRITEELNDNL